MSKKERFESVPIPYFPGIELREEPGSKINILETKRDIEEFYSAARVYTEIDFQIKRLSSARAMLRKRILPIAQKIEGLRGIISKIERFILTVYPSKKLWWNRELLKKSLGIIYLTLVQETSVITIVVPVGYQTKEGLVVSEEVIKEAIRKSLVDLGFSEKELEKLMSCQVDLSVDEEGLNQAIAQKKVVLDPKARNEKVTWNIKVVPFTELEAVKT